MINGVINVYKEKGYTSHDVVAKLRGILKQKKIGHTGTLDPDAQGVLPICLGKATKLCDLLTDKSKTYEAELLLGIVTDTQDTSGKILETSEVLVTEEEVKQCIHSFIGEQQQIPPMYSALKVNGKKLYELAREGKEVERKPRTVNFYEIEILGIQLPKVRMRVHCSKGTYIRTLCHDIGQKLQTGGCMSELLRTQVERFQLGDSLKLSQIEELTQNGQIESYVIAVEDMFESYKKVIMDEKFNSLVYNGNRFRSNMAVVEENQKLENKEQVRIYDSKYKFIGIFEYRNIKEEFVPVKMFLET